MCSSIAGVGSRLRVDHLVGEPMKTEPDDVCPGRMIRGAPHVWEKWGSGFKCAYCGEVRR